MQNFKLKKLATQYGWDLTELELVCSPIRKIAESMADNISSKMWVAGGALRRTILGQPIIGHSDFDLFFMKKENAEECQKQLIALGYHVEKENDTNVQLEKAASTQDASKIKIQLIKIKYYQNLDEVLNSFDFTLCQFGWDLGDDSFVCGDTSLYDIARKRIVVNKITYPVASLRRIIKYTNQGFYACAGCLTNFLTEVQATTGVTPDGVLYFD
jgi:hypothetical protein